MLHFHNVRLVKFCKTIIKSVFVPKIVSINYLLLPVFLYFEILLDMYIYLCYDKCITKTIEFINSSVKIYDEKRLQQMCFFTEEQNKCNIL
jgi:hypothetical protein